MWNLLKASLYAVFHNLPMAAWSPKQTKSERMS